MKDQSFKNNRNVTSQSGLSMVETLIALSILSLLALGHLSWVKINQGSAGHLSEMNSIEDAMDRLRGAFGNDDSNCTRMLGGKALNSSINEIRYFRPDGTERPEWVLKKNEKLDSQGKVKTFDIWLKPMTDLGPLSARGGEPKIVVGDLEVIFGKMFGLTQISRRIPIYMAVANNRIVQCSLSPFGSIVINKKLCEFRNDGYNEYTIEGNGSNVCYEKPGVIWHEGQEPFLATCPSGYKVAVEPEHLGNKSKVVCTIDYRVGVEIKRRTYKSGYETDKDAGPFRAEVDEANSSCRFVTADGLSADNFKFLIKCVKQ